MISQEIVELIKARGLFDDFRHEPYSNALKQQIEESVTKYLADVRWNSTLNKNDIRNKLRTDVLHFQLLLNHTIDLDMQSDFSLKIIKFFERYCLNEKMMSECDFYFSEGLKTPNVSLLVPKKEFNEEIPPLPPSPPKEVVPPPPLPPLPISEFENVDIKPDLASLEYNVDTTFQLKMETEDTNDRPPNALEALDMIKNKLAQLLNTGNLDFNSLDLNLTNLQSVQMTENDLEANSSPNLNDIVVTTSTDNNVYKIDDDLKSSQSCDTTSQLMESLNQSKPKSPQSSTKKFTEIGEGSLAEEILKTVDKNNKSFFTTDEYSKINISPFKPDIISGQQIISSKLQIDKEDISVSSVHTSDLSSLEDQISISSSDLPEMDDDMLVPEETTTQINVKKATNNTKSNESQPIMQHIYNYLLGGYLCPENKDCFDYYQNIVNLNQLQQAKQNAEAAANMSADSEDELMKDLTDHSFANYNALESASLAFKGCPRVFKQQQQQSNLKFKRSPNNDNVQTTPKSEMDALDMMSEKLKYFDEGEEGANGDVAKRTKFSPKSPPSDNTSYHGLYSSEQRFPRYFKEKKDCSFLPVPSLPHLPSSRKTKAEIIAEAYKPKGGANYICKGTSSNTSIKTEESMLAATTDSPNAADIPFDNYYEKRANIKPATPSSKRKYRKKVEGLTAITTTPSDMIILPTQKVREHLKKKVFSKHPHGTKHSNISNQQTAVTTSATKNYEENRESSAPFINTIGEKYEMVPERATSLEKSGGKHHLPLYNRSNDKTWATTADTTNTSLGYTKNYYTPHLHHDRISSNKCSASDTNSPQINTRDPLTNSFSTTNKEPVEQFTYLRNQRHQKFYSKQQSSLYRSGYETKNQGNLLPPPPNPNYYYNEEGRISPYRYKTSGGVGGSLDPRTTITRGAREFNDESQEFLRDDHVSYGGGGSARSNKSRSRSKSIISADSQPPLPSSEPPPQQRFTKPNKQRRFHHPHPPPFHHQRPQTRPFFDHHQMNHRQVVNERIQHHHHQQQLYGEDRRAPPHPPPLPLSDMGAPQRAHQGGGGSQTSTGGEASSYQEEYAGGGGDRSGNSHEYYYHKKFHSSLTHHQLQQQNPYHHHQQH